MIPPIEPGRVLAHQFPQREFEYSERDVALYALGVGAPGVNQLDPLELPYVYHPDGQSSIRVLPTFPVIFPADLIKALVSVPGLHFDPALLLHGEHYVEILKALPTRSKIVNSVRIAGLHDKGKAAIIEVEILSQDRDTGDKLCLNRFTCFLRGAGGFSTSSSTPYSYKSHTPSSAGAIEPSTKGRPNFNAPPDATFEERIQPGQKVIRTYYLDTPREMYDLMKLLRPHLSLLQALLYRLSGDYNPLHSDPVLAARAGFEKPILHGLCSLGFAVRAVLRCCCGGEPSRVRAVQGRFLHHVYPGEMIVTQMWRDDANSRVFFQSTVRERGKNVLSGTVSLQPLLSNL